MVWIRSQNRNRNFSKVGTGTAINHYRVRFHNTDFWVQGMTFWIFINVYLCDLFCHQKLDKGNSAGLRVYRTIYELELFL
jgi:hypothetical protein